MPYEHSNIEPFYTLPEDSYNGHVYYSGRHKECAANYDPRLLSYIRTNKECNLCA